MAPPPIRFPDAVREDLDAHRMGLAEETERMMLAHARPCVAVTATRVSERPLRRSSLARLIGRGAAAPMLPVTASKFGGLPYCESDEDWTRYSFLGQIDLAEATAVLPEAGMRLRGLLRLDAGTNPMSDAVRVRWFPDVDPTRAVDARPPSCGAWETRLDFRLAWSLPEGHALEELWPLPESRWFEYDEFYPCGYNDDASDEYHRLLGHRSAGLDQHYGFTPPAGLTEEIADYESLLRLTFDNRADFAWGTNWIYVLVPRGDLARGDLSRIVVTGANS